MMKRYEITKIVYAHNVSELCDLESNGEIVGVLLKNEVNSPDDVGFIRKNAKEESGKR